MIKVSLDGLNEQELKDLMESCNKILKNKADEQKKERWNQVVQAVREYFLYHGPITIEGDDCFTTITPRNLDKNRPGYISF